MASTSPPSVSRLRAFLEVPRMVANPVAVFHAHLKELGDTYYYHFGGAKRVLVSSDPAVLQHVLKDNYENYRKSDIQMERMRHFLGKGLLTYHGREWMRQRRLIQQGFSPAHLERLAEDMHACLDDSIARLEAATGPVNLAHEMMSITFTMVARSLFGARLAQEEIDTISEAIIRIQGFIVRQIVQPHLLPWFAVSGELRRHEALRERGDAILLRYVRARRGGPAPERLDLLQILLDAVDADTGARMSDGEVLCECMQLLVAGHETSSNALTWTLYLLERHPEQMAKAREELDVVLGEERLGLRHVPRLKVLTRIIEEAMRIYPPFWMVDRMAAADDRVGPLEIPSGSTIIAFLYGVHHGPRRWPDPDVFQPERLGEGDRKTTRGFTYLPFGGGARNCIGSGYAMLQMLMVLSVVLRRLDYSIADGADVEAAPMIILRQRADVTTRVWPRPAGAGRAAHVAPSAGVEG